MYRLNLTTGSTGLVLILFFTTVDSLKAEESGSWTNLAGHVLKASPTALHGQTVTFEQGSNKASVDYPLSLFPPQEQERLRCRLKETSIPEGLQSAHDFSRNTIRRSRLLYAHGQMTESAFQQNLETTLSVFRRQAAPFVLKKELSRERLELILTELAATK